VHFTHPPKNPPRSAETHHSEEGFVPHGGPYEAS
jgi:hypothetical protein